ASSLARARVRPTSADLPEDTWEPPGDPITARVPPMITMAPPPALARCGIASLQQSQVPSSDTSTTRRKLSYERLSSGSDDRSVWLIERMSSRPKRWIVSATSDSTEAG